MAELALSFASGGTGLEVRRFEVRARLSTPFEVRVTARSRRADLDLDELVGRPAAFSLAAGYAHAAASQSWSGVCRSAVQVHPEPTGLSTYEVVIVPRLWLLGLRRGHRVFQHLSIPAIVRRVLGEWAIEPLARIDDAAYPALELKLQAGESDLAFVSRLLEEAGITYAFETADGETRVVLDDAPQARDPRAGGPIPVVDAANAEAEREHVTKVRVAEMMRPGAFAVRDHDFRRPEHVLLGEAPDAAGIEARLERFEYVPSASRVEGGAGGNETPVADVDAVARHEDAALAARASRHLEAARADRLRASFDTNCLDVAPGTVLSLGRHPHPLLGRDHRLLAVETTLRGTVEGEWSSAVEAVSAAVPWRPPRLTPKPRLHGYEVAIVVGAHGEEIHTDEHGRVRVQFPWDREGRLDDRAGTWLRVSHGWAGAGYGWFALPRVGQEVLVAFADGDCDEPFVVGRLHDGRQPVPDALPEHRTRTIWRSDSSVGHGGHNEILFEDLAGEELVHEQAEKNRRRLVKHDETLTTVRDRRRHVDRDETDTTTRDRVEVTAGLRVETTVRDRVVAILRNEARLVRRVDRARIQGKNLVYAGVHSDLVVERSRRVRVEADSHLRVRARRYERVARKDELVVGADRHETVGKRAALEAESIHLGARDMVVEAPRDVTVRAGGGFIRIDRTGVTIRGDVVKINSGGAPGSGTGAAPARAEPAEEARVEAPPRPENVAESFLPRLRRT